MSGGGLRGSRSRWWRAGRAEHQVPDSILKTIATSGAIVLTTALNAAFLDGPWGLSIIAGAIVVVTAVFDYNDKGDPETRLSHAVDRLAQSKIDLRRVVFVG